VLRTFNTSVDRRLRLRDTVKRLHTCMTVYSYFSTVQQCITFILELHFYTAFTFVISHLLRVLTVENPVGNVTNNENLLAKKHRTGIPFHLFKEFY